MAAVARDACRVLLRAALLSILMANGTFAATAPSEYQVKAVFLFNFAHFVEWPPDAFSAPDSPFMICVFGHDPFGTLLEDTVRGEMIGGRSFAISRHHQLSEATGCQILFIDRTAEPARSDELRELAHKGTLTVGEAGGVSPQEDVVIRFIIENQKIRLRINMGSARAAGLTISSKLLRPAQVVGASSRN